MLLSTNILYTSAGQAHVSSRGLPSSLTHDIIIESVHSNTQEPVADGIELRMQKTGSDYNNSLNSKIDFGEENCQKRSQALPKEDHEAGKKEEDKNTSSTEFERTLTELDLSEPDVQYALKLFSEYPKLEKQMKTATECMLSFKSLSHMGCLHNLRKLEGSYFHMNPAERTNLGDLLSCLKFAKGSYAKYVSILRAENSEHFSDLLIEDDGKDNVAIIYILCSIRSLWWNFSDCSIMFGSQLASETGIIQELAQNIVSLTGVQGDKLVCYI